MDASHPALISLVQVAGQPDQCPTMRHDTDHDWWIVQAEGQAVANGTLQKLRIDLVVSGHVDE